MLYPHHTTPSDSPTSSPSNLSLAALEYEECSNLLSESLTMGSVPTASSTESGSVPRFPDGSMVPMATFLLFPRVSSGLGGFSEANLNDLATSTAPTAPRLRTMLRECLSIKKWAETLPPCDAPGHVPWGDVDETLPSTWKPEGSTFAPEEFRQALHNAHHLSQSAAQQFQPVEESRVSSTAPLDLRRNPSTRKGATPEDLVFEREILVSQVSGRPKRWSLQVAASSMDTEMVDIMLELQNLKAYFQEGSADNDLPSPNRRARGVDLFPEAGKVPSGIRSKPLSLISDASRLNKPVKTKYATLAARRGRIIPAPLSVQAKELEYPGLPSAFLGSPTDYSPKPGLISGICSEPCSLGLQDMIVNLRSQCASFPGMPSTPDDIVRPQGQESLSLYSSPTIDTTLVEDKAAHVADGSFAELLSPKDSPLPILARSTASFRALCDMSESSPVDPDGLEDSWGSTPDVTPDARRKQDLRWSSQSPVSNCLPPTPLHARPLSKASIASSSPRGILKSSKSVRFASLPGKFVAKPSPDEFSNVKCAKETDIGVLRPVKLVPDSLKVVPIQSLPPDRRLGPSPLRNSYSPALTMEAPSSCPADASSSPAARRGGLYKRPSVGLQRRHSIMPGKRDASPVDDALTEKRAHSRERRSYTTTGAEHGARFTAKHQHQKQALDDPTAQPHSRHSTGGAALTRVVGEKLQPYGKENQKLQSTKNDGTRKTPYIASPIEVEAKHQERGTKVRSSSRMPVPLRNILTRFK